MLKLYQRFDLEYKTGAKVSDISKKALLQKLMQPLRDKGYSILTSNDFTKNLPNSIIVGGVEYTDNGKNIEGDFYILTKSLGLPYKKSLSYNSFQQI